MTFLGQEMKSTIQRLYDYQTALEKWERKKFAFDSNVAKKLVNKKPLEPEPTPDLFQISRDDEYARKLRIQVLGIKPKYPVRKA